MKSVGWCTQDGIEGTVEAPVDLEESQGERVRRSLVMLDVHLPSIALPDGVHCRAFVGVQLPRSHVCVPHQGHDDDHLHLFHSAVGQRDVVAKGTRLCAGNGVIVHHSEKLGLVVTDRNTASVSVGDVRMSFGAHPAEVEGRIRFLHPLHNFAILSYNPADLPEEVRPRVLQHMPRICVC